MNEEKNNKNKNNPSDYPGDLRGAKIFRLGSGANPDLEVDMEQIILKKHEYNKSRPYRHGGKKC